MRIKFTAGIILLLLFSQTILAHRGGYDKYGGHIGGDCSYHCSQKYREKCNQAKANLPEALRVRIKECKDKKEEDTNKDFQSLLPKYDAKSYKFWSDFDNDCRDTRAEILIDSSLVPVTFTNDSQCKVKTGWWVCPYSGREYTYARDIHIDHVVSRGEAHISGAAYWSEKKKELFANDKDNLLAVAGSANMEKGAKDPSKWLPTASENICSYIAQWINVKKKWNLTMDVTEEKTILKIQEDCPSSKQ